MRNGEVMLNLAVSAYVLFVFGRTLYLCIKSYRVRPKLRCSVCQTDHELDAKGRLKAAFRTGSRSPWHFSVNRWYCEHCRCERFMSCSNIKEYNAAGIFVARQLVYGILLTILMAFVSAFF